jgi:predicted permease
MLVELIPVLAPVFIAVGLGYLWARVGQAFHTDFVTRLVALIGTPCLAFSTLTTGHPDPGTFGTVALGAVLGVTVFAVVGGGAMRLAGIPVRPYLPTVMLPNAGNLGLPVALFAFGEQGLALAIAFTMVIMILHHTVGVALAAGRASPATVARTPVIYAIAAGLAFVLTDTAPPVWLANTTGLLAGLTIPLMLISLGVSLASLRIANLRRSLSLALLRLGMGFVVGVGLVRLLGLDGVAAGVLMLQCAMPAAVFNYLYAARYDGPAAEVAGAVVLSTLIAFATMPVLLWFVLMSV